MNSNVTETEKVESNKIGLQSVKKMVELQQGTLFAAEEKDTFAVTLQFPLSP
ncbi:MAG: hypothetical protein RR139_00880 [Lachnospiraceae bacterium]